jgi:hypothetical protein
MDDDIPVVVQMRVECAKCGYHEDDTYEFDDRSAVLRFGSTCGE